MAKTNLDHILFGAAYYDEYVPSDLNRIDEDMSMMKAAGMNVIRIAESTWSTEEPQPGVFDFSHVDRALDAAHRAGIDVIVGTPTYAVPTWMVAMHPDVLAVTPHGPGKYGSRQIMDIVNPTYRFYAERIIRKLISHVADHPAVIGYQIDNETKYYDSVSPDMQALFIKHLRERFQDDLDLLNESFGLDYWSNRINAWEDFPDVTNTINGSLGAAFDRFRRHMVAEFLSWQASIVREYARDDQFITHNLDYDWKPGWSYGVQPYVDHYEAGKALDIAGVDIYHPSGDHLTGHEIGFGGDYSRSVKDGGNFIVLETQAQGQHGWLPMPGQLRLQAYSHLANGADGVMYWHWSSIHNSWETYWKGVLSHDYEPNPTYREAGVFGHEIEEPSVQSSLIHLRKHNTVAIMTSNEALTAIGRFHVETGDSFGKSIDYNDVVRAVYDTLFDLNIECDFVPADASPDTLSRYTMVVVPSLYVATQATIDTLRDYVHDGGHLVALFRSFVADDNMKVWHDVAPHGLTDVFGMSYNQFTRPNEVGLVPVDGSLLADCKRGEATALIELLRPKDGCTVLVGYDHYGWDAYAAVTRNDYGQGTAEWIGTMPDRSTLAQLLSEAADHAGIQTPGRELAGTITVRRGVNVAGHDVTFLLNYSSRPVRFESPVSGYVIVGSVSIDPDGEATTDVTRDVDGLSGRLTQAGDVLAVGDPVTIGPWNCTIVETGLSDAVGRDDVDAVDVSD